MVVSSPEVAEPVQVRYALAEFHRCQSLQQRSAAGIHVFGGGSLETARMPRRTWRYISLVFARWDPLHFTKGSSECKNRN